MLQGVEQPGFEFGGDVTVDVLDLVGDAVAEAAGLDDVGDAVGDEPGFVAVPQPVEGQPAGDRLDRDGRLWLVGGAVGGGAHGAAGEVRAAQKRPVPGGEHMVVGVGVQVLAQQRDQERGQRDGAGGLGGLGRPEVELPVHFVQRPTRGWMVRQPGRCGAGGGCRGAGR